MLIIYCIGLFDGCFGSGVWQCWNCRVPFFLLGWRGGRQRKVASVRGWMQLWMLLRFCRVDVDEGRQRKVASVRAGTPSGDTTRAP